MMDWPGLGLAELTFLARVSTGDEQAFSSTDTLLEPLLATAKSLAPSPLKSLTVTEYGKFPTPKLVATPKPPLPLPNSTDTLLEPKLATAKSLTLSPSKSPTATEKGRFPTP